MLGIVQDRVLTPGQEWWRERNIVKSKCAGFRCQIHLKSRSGQHLVRMQSLYEEHTCLVATGIDRTIEAGNCDKGLAGKFLRHDFSSWLHPYSRVKFLLVVLTAVSPQTYPFSLGETILSVLLIETTDGRLSEFFRSHLSFRCDHTRDNTPVRVASDRASQHAVAIGIRFMGAILPSLYLSNVFVPHKRR